MSPLPLTPYQIQQLKSRYSQDVLKAYMHLRQYLDGEDGDLATSVELVLREMDWTKGALERVSRALEVRMGLE
jgi:cytolysin (calcineurin-like family phosphatase)